MTAAEWKVIAPVGSLISSILSSSPRWHPGRVSVSLHPPVTGCSQACPHAWDTTKQRHLMLSNRRHVLRCRKPSDFVTCGTLPIVVNTCNDTILFQHDPFTSTATSTPVEIPVIWAAFYKKTALIKNQTVICFHKSIYLDMR